MKKVRELTVLDKRKVLRSEKGREAYCKQLRELYRKRNYIDWEHARRRVITNPLVLSNSGQVTYITFRGYVWEGRVFTYHELCVLADMPFNTLTYSLRRSKVLPKPVFKAPYLRQMNEKFRWRLVYLYEEVVVILKYFAIAYEDKLHFRAKSPEAVMLNDELNRVRSEVIKEKMKDDYDLLSRRLTNG